MLWHRLACQDLDRPEASQMQGKSSAHHALGWCRPQGCQRGGHLSGQLHLMLDGAILAAGAESNHKCRSSKKLQALILLASHRIAEERSATKGLGRTAGGVPGGCASARGL